MLLFESLFDLWWVVTWEVISCLLSFNPCYFGANRQRLLLNFLTDSLLLFHNNTNIKISKNNSRFAYLSIAPSEYLIKYGSFHMTTRQSNQGYYVCISRLIMPLLINYSSIRWITTFALNTAQKWEKDSLFHSILATYVAFDVPLSIRNIAFKLPKFALSLNH